jgi:hypothetical protein
MTFLLWFAHVFMKGVVSTRYVPGYLMHQKGHVGTVAICLSLPQHVQEIIADEKNFIRCQILLQLWAPFNDVLTPSIIHFHLFYIHSL